MGYAKTDYGWLTESKNSKLPKDWDGNDPAEYEQTKWKFINDFYDVNIKIDNLT